MNLVESIRRVKKLKSLTLQKLIQSTKKARRHTNPVKKVSIVEMKPVPRTKQLIIKAQSLGTSSNTIYNTSIVAHGVEYKDEQSKEAPLTVSLGNGDYKFIEQLSLSNTHVSIRCSCKDFYFMWSHWNKEEHSLMGRPFPKYKRKTPAPPEGRPYVNPGEYPGLCKHLQVLVDKLNKEGLIKK